MLKIIIKSIILSFLVLSCKEKPREPSYYLENGMKYAKKKNFEACKEQLNKLEEVAPYSAESKTGIPILTYCMYANGNYEEMSALIENFEAVYPTSDKIAYLYYIKALSYFRMIKNYKKTHENIENFKIAFNKVEEKEPDSAYYRNLQKLMPFMEELEVHSNMYIAKNYSARKQFISAASRYSKATQKNKLTEEQYKIVNDSMNVLLQNMGVEDGQ